MKEPFEMTNYDALILVSFGGPEKREDVIPFLENVLRGRNIPRERMLEVAEHYYHFDGVSPINNQCRELLAALKPELQKHGIDLPVYWGNRNWYPLLSDTLAQMKADGIRRALAIVTSAYSSYSGCRQYRENLLNAQASVGENAPEIDKLRVFYNHPLFISAQVARGREALEKIPSQRRDQVHIAFTAHSIPLSMSRQCEYLKQLEETCRLVAEQLAIPEERWKLVFQSRSGRPEDPWLDPDIVDHLRAMHVRGDSDVVIYPIGFLSDHMEVMYDLDEEARLACEEMGLNMVRAGTVGSHPDFIAMLRELIQERLDPSLPKRAVGKYGPSHDVCPVDCCPAPVRPQRPAAPVS